MVWKRTTNKPVSPPELPTEQELSDMALELNLRLFCDFPAEGALTREKLLWVDRVTAAAVTAPPERTKRGGLFAALLRFIRRLLHWEK